MKPYACCRVNDQDQKMLEKIEKIIKKMPEVDLGLDSGGQNKLVSCHMLTRAIGVFFPVKVHDGYFCKNAYCHSWLTTEESLIDVYPIAMIGGPILIDKKGFNPWYSQYVDQELTVLSFDIDEKKFKSDVEKVTLAVKQTMKKLRFKTSQPKYFGL